jgi:hypothetical protein
MCSKACSPCWAFLAANANKGLVPFTNKGPFGALFVAMLKRAALNFAAIVSIQAYV